MRIRFQWHIGFETPEGGYFGVDMDELDPEADEATIAWPELRTWQMNLWL